MTKYEKLTHALHAAKANAERCANDDGGATNFDTACVVLPRWDKTQVRKSFEAAGLKTDVWKLPRASVFVVLGCYTGQGIRRTKQAEAIRDSLESAGYQAHVIYQID